MKICVLRRDGQKVHNGMAMVIASITEKFFGEKEMFIDKNEQEFTEILNFEIEDNEEEQLVMFIKEVSRVNPLYAVRINA